MGGAGHRPGSRAIEWGGKGEWSVPYEEGRAEHRVLMEDRERLLVSGVEEVERFDEETILLTTSQGGMEIRGEGLHIEQLSLDGGDLKVEGRVAAISYDVDTPVRGGLFSRLFGP